MLSNRLQLTKISRKWEIYTLHVALQTANPNLIKQNFTNTVTSDYLCFKQHDHFRQIQVNVNKIIDLNNIFQKLQF